MKDTYDVVVVGAGFAGLACGTRLRQRGVTNFAIVEQADDVGAFWRGNYDRIRLHSPFHDLPDDGGARRRWGVFLHRDELLAYFEGYARRHELYDVLQTESAWSECAAVRIAGSSTRTAGRSPRSFW